jgi:fructose-1,6-bisphosphatase/inositol monophosphatase family enzyme
MAADLERMRELVCRLHAHIREVLLRSRQRNRRTCADIVAVTTADTIYRIDRLSEHAIVEWFQQHWPRAWPVEIVMEGIEDSELVTMPRGVAVKDTAFKCIIDPIDGTRGLMYDKRSAWILTGIAPQRGARTAIADVVVAVMTEIPVTKQWRADQFSAVRGRGVQGRATDVRTGVARRLPVRPSQATDFKHGFASFARFFITGKSQIAQIEEAFWTALHGRAVETTPLVFDDQYISTGGQLAELLVGHDRLIVDLRPLVFEKLNAPSALVCHPYDICTELILREAGGVVETPDGRPIRAPLDTTSPVSWVGYANLRLAKLARPALRRALEHCL